MHIINAANVAILRDQRRMSLDELAREAGVNKQTIHRIEKGLIKTPRAHTVKCLARGLRTTADILYGPTVEATAVSAPEAASKSQMNVRVSDDVRNALSLVALRYGIKSSIIVEAAPLLFHCFAEMSLKVRQQKLDAFEERLTLLRRDGLDHVPLGGLDYWEIDAALARERHSIESKDVFGGLVHEFNEMAEYFDVPVVDSENNPLKKYIDTIAEEVGGAEVHFFSTDLGIIYSLGERDALYLMNDDETAADHIVNGRVLIHEVPKALWAVDQVDERVRWVLEKGEEWLRQHPPRSPREILDEVLESREAK